MIAVVNLALVKRLQEAQKNTQTSGGMNETFKRTRDKELQEKLENFR